MSTFENGTNIFPRSEKEKPNCNCLIAGESLRASTLFCTIVGKSQILSDVRSEACTFDWFSYPGYPLLCGDIM